MEYLQYWKVYIDVNLGIGEGFKPYYKWNTFNTKKNNNFLNVVMGFKPYYKWNTFNTKELKKIG